MVIEPNIVVTLFSWNSCLTSKNYPWLLWTSLNWYGLLQYHFYQPHIHLLSIYTKKMRSLWTIFPYSNPVFKWSPCCGHYSKGIFWYWGQFYNDCSFWTNFEWFLWKKFCYELIFLLAFHHYYFFCQIVKESNHPICWQKMFLMSWFMRFHSDRIERQNLNLDWTLN